MGELRSLLPKLLDETDTGRSESPTSTPLISKRKLTSLACESCRKRKTKCDGQRPRCFACAQRGASFCVYRTKTQTLSVLGETLQQLQTLPRNEALDLLHTLRTSPSTSSLPVTPRGAETDAPSLPQSPSMQQLLRGLLPSTQNSLEFELSVRHPTAYPTLYPVHLDSLPLETILKPRRLSWLPSPSLYGETLPRQGLSPKLHPSVATESETRQMRRDSNSIHPRPLVDARLNHLKISSWTGVPISDALAAHIISLYLELDYPAMPLFNADLFLDDLIHNRTDFCCPFLVNSLLCFGCEIYTGINPNATALTVEFYSEAQRRWADEIQHNFTITAIAGVSLLSMAVITYGRDDLAKKYLSDGVKMAKQLGLFGSQTAHTSLSGWLDQGDDKWTKGVSYTAWGVFNWACNYGLHYQTAWIKTPPTLPMPHIVSDDDHTLLNEQVLEARCQMSVIVNDVLWEYYHDHGMHSSSQRASLEFAEKTYHRFLRWAASLPLNLVRSDRSNHAIFLLHIYYHAIITDLFRPFLEPPWDSVCLQSFSTANATAHAVYSASLNQLKRLLLIYRLKFKLAALSVLWQTGVIYVANGMIREAHTAASPEWRFYFELCMAALEDLTCSFRVFETIAHALLGMALQRDVIGMKEANGVAKRLQDLSRHHIPIEDAKEDRARLIIDLDLGVTDPDAAQGSALAEQFQGLLLMEEFTTGKWYEYGERLN